MVARTGDFPRRREGSPCSQGGASCQTADDKPQLGPQVPFGREPLGKADDITEMRSTETGEACYAVISVPAVTHAAAEGGRLWDPISCGVLA